MDPPVIKVIFRRHDPDNTNSLSLDEYIRMCLFLQSCVRCAGSCQLILYPRLRFPLPVTYVCAVPHPPCRTFGAFDSQQKGTISLDFNQFVYAAGHV